MLNKKVALPWGLFALTAMYAMMRPCNTCGSVQPQVLCNSTDVQPGVPQQYVELHPDSDYAAFQNEEPVQVHSDAEGVHYVRHRTEHVPVHVQAPVHVPVHVQAPVQADEHPPTLFVMSVTLLLYLFIKVVVVPPRGYKKYI